MVATPAQIAANRQNAQASTGPMTPEGKMRFERFVRDYEVVRAKEGWGSETPGYYHALPFKDLTNKHDWIWRSRAQTLRYMLEHVLPKIESAGSSPMSRS